MLNDDLFFDGSQTLVLGTEYLGKKNGNGVRTALNKVLDFNSKNGTVTL